MTFLKTREISEDSKKRVESAGRVTLREEMFVYFQSVSPGVFSNQKKWAWLPTDLVAQV